MLIENATTCRGKLGVTDFDCSCWDSGFLFRQSWKYSVPGQQNPEKNVAKSKLTISCFVLNPSLPRCVCVPSKLWCRRPVSPAAADALPPKTCATNLQRGKTSKPEMEYFDPRLGVYILLRVGIKAAEKYGHQCSRSESELLHCTAQESLGEIHLPDLQLQGRTRPYSLTSQWLNVQEINQTQP